MGRSLRFLIVSLVVLIVVGSCGHIDGPSRDPAAKDSQYKKACGELHKKGYEDELAAFKNLVRSERGVNEALYYLAQAASPMGLDRAFGQESITLEMFVDENKDIAYGRVEDFARQILYACDVIRNGETFSACIEKNDSPSNYKARANQHEKDRLANLAELKKELGATSPDYLRELETSSTYEQVCGPYFPNAFEQAEKFCGKADKYLSKKKRAHPDLLREWIDPEANVEISINDWVAQNGGLWDAKRDDWFPIDQAVTACKQFQTKREKKTGRVVQAYQNVEDSIEHLFLCFGSFNNSIAFYKAKTDQSGYLVRDKNKQLVPRDRKNEKQRNKVLKTCLSGYLQNSIKLDEDDAPDVGSAKQSPEPESTSKPKSHGGKTQTTDSTDPGSVVYTDNPQPNPTASPTGKPGGSETRKGTKDGALDGVFPKTAPRETPCLPGDNPGRMQCRSDDACVRSFAYQAEKTGMQLPAALDTKTMLELYKDDRMFSLGKGERASLTKAMAKHQAELLALGYITMAFQREWDAPAQYNRNLDDFTSSCGNSSIVAELSQKMKAEKIDEAAVDGAYDIIFAAQRSNTESLGRQMIAATRRIAELRKYASILKRDTGAGEMTGKIPDFMPPEVYMGLSIVAIPLWPYTAFLHYISGKDLLLDTNAYLNYQCNWFGERNFVTRTDDLLTDADREMRKKWLDKTARDRAFCDRDADGRIVECNVPRELEQYINSTDPSNFNFDDGRQKFSEIDRKIDEAKIKEAEKKFKKTSDVVEKAKLTQDIKKRKRRIKFGAMKLAEIIDYRKKYNQKYKDLRMDIIMRDKVLSADEEDFMFDYEQADAETTVYQTSNQDWCRMRYNAAQAVIDQSIQLATLYPVLAYAIPKADNKSGAPYISHIEKRLVQIDQDKSLDDEARKTAYDKLAKEINVKAQEVLPQTQDNIKKYVTKVCKDMNMPVNLESVFEATLNGSLASGFEYCTDDSEKKAGLTCQERLPFLACKLGHEARSWYDDKQRPRFFQELGLSLLDAAPVLGAASGALKAAFTIRGVIWGGAVGVGFMAGNDALSRHLARNVEGRWVDHNNAVAAMALEGIDSYTNSIATIAALKSQSGTKDFLLGFVMGAVGSGLVHKGSIKNQPQALEYRVSNKVLDEITLKINDFADNKITRADLNDYLLRKTAEYPDLLDDLPRRMADHLSTMSDGIYAQTFGGGKNGMLAATRARQTMGTYFRRNAIELYKSIDRLKADINKKALNGEKLSQAEAALAQPTLDILDLSKFIDKIGPREIALLARETETFLRRIEDASPKKKAQVAAEYLKKLSGLEIACAGGSCASMFRTRFYVLTHSLKIIRSAAQKLLEKATRTEVARADDVAAHLKQFELDMKEYAKTNGIDEVTAFERYGKILEEEIATATQNRKTSPPLAKLLAVLAYRSPNLRNNLMLSLDDFTAARWRYRSRTLGYLAQSLRTAPRKIHKALAERRFQRCLVNPQCSPDTLARLLEKVESKISEKGAPISEGHRLFDLFMHRLRLPERKMLSSKDFPLMLEELNNMLIQMNYPDSLWVPWTKAFGRAATIKENWNVVRYVAEQVERDSGARWRAMVEGTDIEVWGKPRREALEHSFEKGLIDWVVTRTVKVAKENDLKDSYMSNAVFKAEVEQLSLEVMVVLKPVLGAVALFAINEGIDWLADAAKPNTMTPEQQAEFDDIKNNPEKYRERNPEMVLDALKNLEEDIELNTLLLRDLEKDLEEGSPSPEEAQQLRADIELVKHTLKEQNDLKEQTLRSLKRYDQ